MSKKKLAHAATTSAAATMPWQKLAPAFSPEELSSLDARVAADWIQWADDMNAEIEAADASRHALANLSPSDAELLSLIEDLERIARSSRQLLENPEAWEPFAGGKTWLEWRKRAVQTTLEKMRTIWYGAQPSEGAPYRAARMAFVDAVRFEGRLEKGAPSKDAARRRARRLATRLAKLYPAPAARLHEPDRQAKIREAIIAHARTARVPWKSIVAAWRGIEAGADNAETWRDDWKKRDEQKRG